MVHFLVVTIAALLAVFTPVPQVDAGAYDPALVWPDRLSLSRMYEIPAIFAPSLPLEVAVRVGFALNYISTCSNLRFPRRPMGYPDGIVFTYVPICTPNHVRTQGYDRIVTVRLGKSCSSTAAAVRRILQAVGMVEEHQRPDRDLFLTLSSYAKQQYPIVTTAIQKTPYDVASVLHPNVNNYTEQFRAGLQIINPDLRHAASGSRTFLTLCDWATLNTMYPGLCPVPDCKPGHVPLASLPSTTLILDMRGNRTKANDICRYDNEMWFDFGSCRFVGDAEFPVYKYYREINMTPPMVLRRSNRPAHCERYISVNTTVLSEYECKVACFATCPRRFQLMEVPDCMQVNFPLCKKRF